MDRSGILAVDTAGPVLGVALRVNGQCVTRKDRIARGGEAFLIPWAQELAKELGVKLSHLQGVAVTVGPGTFTGLRVGLATATGLALAAGIPVWGCSSLLSRSRFVQQRQSGVSVLAMLDARKGRVYASLYDKDGACVMGPEDLPPEQALQWLHGVEGDVVCMGEGALRYQEQIESDGRTIANQVDDPAVDVLAELGESAIFRGEGCSPQDLQAMYVRIPDALRTKDRSSKSKVISGSQ